MTKHRPTTVKNREWWKHLRPFWKREFWKRDRKASKQDILDAIEGIMKTYILVNGEPVHEPDIVKWGKWFEDSSLNGTRTIGVWLEPTEGNQTLGGDGVMVSTVFLGIDHAFGEGSPILWETMVRWKSGDWDMQSRYTSKEAAVKGHETTLKRVQAILSRRKQEQETP